MRSDVKSTASVRMAFESLSLGLPKMPKLNSFEWLVLFYININMLKVAVRVTIGRGFIYSLAAAGLEVVLLLWILSRALFSDDILDLLLISLTYLFSLMLSIAINPKLGSIFTNTLRRFLPCLEGYYLFSRLPSIDSVKKLVPYSALLMIPYCYVILTSSTIDHYDNSDYFVISYGIIIPISLIIAYGYHSFIYIAIAIIGLFVILYAGARGAFVCVIGVVSLLLVHKVLFSKGVRKALLLLMIAIGFFIVITYTDQAAAFLYRIMPDSRTIARMVSGGAVFDSRRLEMYSRLQSAILRHPLLYRGILSDRLVGSSVWMMYDSASLAGTYAHNLFLEVLYGHGVILGGLMLVMGAWYLFRAYGVARGLENEDALILFLVLVGCALTQLMFSSSYLVNYHFWCLVGFVKLLLSSQFMMPPAGKEKESLSHFSWRSS